MVEHDLAKVDTAVRFCSPAPDIHLQAKACFFMLVLKAQLNRFLF